MQLREFMEAADRYRSEGDAVLDQLADVLDGGDKEEQNANALGYAAQMLRDLVGYEIEGAAEAAEELEGYLRERGDDGD